MGKETTAVGLVKLSRYQEYLIFVIATTLLGFVFSRPETTPEHIIKLCIVLAANMLSVCFSFMINDVEDAPDDALSPEKVHRNPISAGILSRRTGMVASLGVGIIAILSFFPLGTVPFLLGLLTVALGFLYSWKAVRLKSIPILDLISHGLMLAGLQFLCSYFSFTSYHGLTPDLLLPLLLVVSTSMYGELYNEVRDFTYDKMAGITHTATLVGKANTHILMYILLAIAGGAILYSVFLQMIPMWFIFLYIVLGGIFFLKFLQAFFIHKHMHHTDDIQNYVLIITATSLSIWTVVHIFGL